MKPFFLIIFFVTSSAAFTLSPFFSEALEEKQSKPKKNKNDVVKAFFSPHGNKSHKSWQHVCGSQQPIVEQTHHAATAVRVDGFGGDVFDDREHAAGAVHGALVDAYMIVAENKAQRKGRTRGTQELAYALNVREELLSTNFTHLGENSTQKLNNTVVHNTDVPVRRRSGK